jgi:hypothetical protein
MRFRCPEMGVLRSDALSRSSGSSKSRYCKKQAIFTSVLIYNYASPSKKMLPIQEQPQTIFSPDIKTQHIIKDILEGACSDFPG